MNAAEVLIINLNKNMDLNADVIEGFNVNLDGYKVIAVNLDKNTDDALAFLNRVKNESKGTRSIGVSEKVSISLIQRIIECGGVFRLLENTNNLQEAIQEATASSAPEATMNGADNANKLQALTDDLEALIDRREKSLHRANKRALNTNKQTVALYHALLAVHEAKSVAEVETLLLTVLQNPLELVWVRVFYVDPTDLETHLSRLQKLHFYKTPLKVGSESLGFIVFARAVDRAFSKGEDELLHQVSESVALALDRLAKQDQTETLKQQWDSTFNAISEPLCLTDENFNILRTNKRFCETVGIPERKLVGKNAFAQFADPDTPPTRHASSDRFLIQRHFGGSREPRYFEVTSQRVAGGDKSVVMILFRDVTEQKRIERQIFEASKMAELGTIGSSIAHEINNPLAGMMSFLQLIKMDLKKEDPLRSDIEEMERRGSSFFKSIFIN